MIWLSRLLTIEIWNCLTRSRGPPSRDHGCLRINKNMAGTITALKIQKKNPQRVNVYLDGEFAFGLSRIVAAWLHTGQNLDDAKIGELLENDRYEVAYQRAIKYIGFRERSEYEVRQYLRKLKLSDQTSDAILTRLVHAGLINDQRFAQMWVDNRAEHHPRSQRALAFELRQHGISDKTIEATLDSFNEEENAYKAAKKQSLKYLGLEWRDFRNRIFTYLARNGFNSEVITPIINKVWDEQKMNPNLPSNEANQ